MLVSVALIVACSSPPPQPQPAPPDDEQVAISDTLKEMIEALGEAIGAVERVIHEKEQTITEQEFEYIQKMRDELEEIKDILEYTQYDIEELLGLKKRLEAMVKKYKLAEELPFSQRWKKIFSKIEYATQDLRELLGEE